MKLLITILLLSCLLATNAQQGFTFTRFSTDDNSGLSTNVVYSLHQDEKGYIWIGNANGLQRFDGSTFNHFNIDKPGNDHLPYSMLSQIIPVDKGGMLLNFAALQEFGIFYPSTLTYKKLAIKPAKRLSPKTMFYAWKDSKGEVFLNVFRYGVLHYSKEQAAFVDDNFFHLPQGFIPALSGVFDDSIKNQVWFVGPAGICIYDRSSRSVWHRNNNPQGLPLLKNETIQDNPTQIFIDRQRRFWVFGWPKNSMAGQIKQCLDSAGHYLTKDTTNLQTVNRVYTEYDSFFETPRSGLWIYGVGVLFNWDAENRRFNYSGSTSGASNNTIEYDKVNQLLEDHDGNIWVATNRGLYFTSYSSGTYSVVNFLFDEDKGDRNIEDILEMPGKEFWFASWGDGVLVVDSLMQQKKVPIYNTPPPASWPAPYRDATRLAWNLYYYKQTGEVYIGCNGGVMVAYDPVKKTTRYLWPAETGNSTIRFITEDKVGQLWIGTQSGRLLKGDGKMFTQVLEVGNIIYKIFVDDEGLLWLATQDRGLYCVDPKTGTVVYHFTADGTAKGLYSNSGRDIEQLHDGTIVYAAGALNFINKKTGLVRQLRYEDGLPSNSVDRLRLDADGFLWMISATGLSRYNPYKGRITTYGRKDGITLAGKTNYTDYLSTSNYVMFGGGNAVMMFKPSVFAASQPPPDVIITDFRIFSQFIPVDSLLSLSHVTLEPDQNTFTINFSSLSYQQRDRLTYHFKLEGVDKDWQTADGVYFQNYSLLPPGDYVFKVYAENVEGLRSGRTTELHIRIRPPFWRTKWFMSTVVFLILLVIYFLHRERVNRLLAVEKIRNRVARDLHDDMGSTLSTINILSAMAKSKMTSDAVKTTSYLTKISDNSQRMMEAMDDIVWSIKPSNDSMQRITARMREFATNVLEAKDILLRFAVTDEVADVKLNMEARRDFFLIFKEALNNAAKYSKATEVWVDVATERRQLFFCIKDNGVGFDVAKADGGNGLGNMRKRADAINGRLAITSKPGEGATVKLMIPVK